MTIDKNNSIKNADKLQVFVSGALYEKHANANNKFGNE